jgi:hypothetical protein
VSGQLGAAAVHRLRLRASSISPWSDADFDGTPYDLRGVVRRTQDERQFSQELQAHGNALDGRLDWTGARCTSRNTANSTRAI